MTLVLDASAVVDILLQTDRGLQLDRGLTQRADEDMLTVAHLDAEVLSALARAHRAGDLNAENVTTSLHDLSDMVLTRMPIGADLLEAAWDLRHNVYAKDALYVALAQALGAQLVTTDGRLARAVPELVARFDGPNGDVEE
ncbi:type II toxin-antitoxin system VapC family toxin [soil metagenome]